MRSNEGGSNKRSNNTHHNSVDNDVSVGVEQISTASAEQEKQQRKQTRLVEARQGFELWRRVPTTYLLLTYYLPTMVRAPAAVMRGVAIRHHYELSATSKTALGFFPWGVAARGTIAPITVSGCMLGLRFPRQSDGQILPCNKQYKIESKLRIICSTCFAASVRYLSYSESNQTTCSRFCIQLGMRRDLPEPVSASTISSLAPPSRHISIRDAYLSIGIWPSKMQCIVSSLVSTAGEGTSVC